MRFTDRDRREDQEKNAVTVLIAEPIWGDKEILKKEPSNAVTLSEEVNKNKKFGHKNIVPVYKSTANRPSKQKSAWDEIPSTF